MTKLNPSEPQPSLKSLNFSQTSRSKFMRTTTTLILFFLTQILAAQSVVRGIVTDANSKEALIGVSVRTEAVGATTDAEGRFALTLKGGRTVITFSYVGYEPQTRTLDLKNGESIELEIRLDDGSNLLNTATVTAGKFEKPLGEVTVSLDVVKPRLIESTNTTVMSDLLKKVPGVTILDGQAQIRSGSGFSYGAGTRVLLLLDDMPALQPDAGFPNWRDLPVENTSQIEVLKGAASALYGSSAMNGIINIRTGYAKDKPETDAAVWGKVFSAPQNEALAWWKRDTTKMLAPYEAGFSVSHRQKFGKTDFVLGTFAQTYRNYNDKNYGDYGRITPNFRFRIHDRLTLGLNSSFNFGRSGDFFVWKNDSLGAFQAGLNSESRSLGRLRFTIDPSATYTDRRGNRHKFLGRYFFVHNKLDRDQSNDSRNYYGEYQFQRNFEGIGLVLTTGGVAQRSTVDAKLYSNASYAANNLAGYFQLDWKVLEKLNLSTGVRYEFFEQHSPEVFPNLNGGNDTIPGGKTSESKPVYRFGANYQVGQATYLRASYGQGFRYPTIAEKFITTAFSTGNSVVPNAKLQSESGWTAEIGIKQGLKFGENWKGYADLTGFVSEYSRMMEFVLAKIAFVPPTIESFFQSQNIGDTRIEGYEFTLAGQGRIGNGTLYLLGGYTRTFPKYKDFEKDGKTSSLDTVNVLKYRFEHQVKWDSEYEWKKLSVGVSLQYNSYMRAIDRIFENDFVEPFRAVKKFRREHNSGTAIWDLRASYKLTNRVKAQFLVNNLTNVLYMNRPALLEAPRNFTLRLAYKV